MQRKQGKIELEVIYSAKLGYSLVTIQFNSCHCLLVTELDERFSTENNLIMSYIYIYTLKWIQLQGINYLLTILFPIIMTSF